VPAGDPAFVVVWAFAARVPRRSLKLLAELNEINQRVLTVNVCWNGDLVIVNLSIHAVSVTKDSRSCLPRGRRSSRRLECCSPPSSAEKLRTPALDSEDQEQEAVEPDD
jgi:hypothetical protein